jgi:hypothetical protein
MRNRHPKWRLKYLGKIQRAGLGNFKRAPTIDTGEVIYQTRIEPLPEDCFSTYPYLQIVAAIPLLKKTISDVRDGKLQVQSSGVVSKLYYLPTLWGYLVRRWRDKVR